MADQIPGKQTLPAILLFLASIIAFIVANTEFNEYYQQKDTIYFNFNLIFWSKKFSITHFVNDALMAIFFLLIGLEVKKEILFGSLSQIKQALFPLFGAIGGVLFPALIFMAFAYNHPEIKKGWAIPTATDIAFVLGLFGILGKRVSVPLIMLVMTIAVIDDIIAIAIISIFYSGELNGMAILIVAVLATILYLMNRTGVMSLFLYLAVGLLLWIAMIESGIHATLSGIIIAAFIPSIRIKSLEHQLSPWVSFLILPIFAFTNSGVHIMDMGNFSIILTPLSMGIITGLFVGKQIGIFLFLYIAKRAKIAECDKSITLSQLYGMSMACGIGFTMSLFIALIGFAGESEFINQAKIGILLGSFISGVSAYTVLRFFSSTPNSATN